MEFPSYSSFSVGYFLFICLFCYVACGQFESGPEVFDFIIVGGGTGGLAVAGRLSENPNHSVLVLERGTLPEPWLDIPGQTSEHWTDQTVTHYTSVPQIATGVPNKRIIFHAGNMLGGSSQLNGMFVNRGSPHDYDNWALITGDPSWSYQNMLKYFKKFENYNGSFTNDLGQHGFGGPITVSRTEYAPGLTQWMEGGQFLGYQIADPNGPQRVSFTPVEVSKSRGWRVSSYTGYIKPVQASRPNLKIMTSANVRRILFEGNNAVGVRYTNPNLTHPVVVLARKEIIISAGAMNSPAILMRSGIGPIDLLTQCGITPVRILPVGKNLQEHFSVLLDFILDNNDPSLVLIQRRDFTPFTFNYFMKFGDGPYSSDFGTSSQGFVASSVSPKNGIRNWPDLHLISAHSPNYPANKELKEYRKSYDGLIDNGFNAAVTTLSMVTRPKSRGRVTLNTTNIDADPVIDFGFLTHPDDLQASIEAIKHTVRLFETTPAFQRLNARFSPVPYPPCAHIRPFKSDDYWRCHARHIGNTGLHAAGTCRMGRGPEDPQAVVDSKLRVIGINGLRVADTSVQPDVVNCNTQASVYAIAEKAADMIKEVWG